MEEANAVVWTQVVNPEGFVISITSRDGGEIEQSYQNIATFLADNQHLKPYASYRNVLDVPNVEVRFEDDDAVNREAKDKGLVAEAQSLGGVEFKIPEGHNYLGMKGGKIDDIKENDSYTVPAVEYSWDGGDWVNFFFGGGKAVAGFYYKPAWAKKAFAEMFHWEPMTGADRVPIPGGDIILYILGVKGKKSDDIYQNIKDVQLQ